MLILLLFIGIAIFQILYRATRVSHPITNLTVTSVFPLLQELCSVVAFLSSLTSELSPYFMHFCKSWHQQRCVIVFLLYNSHLLFTLSWGVGNQSPATSYGLYVGFVVHNTIQSSNSAWTQSRNMLLHITVKMSNLSCLSQICLGKVSGLRRWLDLLDKNPATIILIPIWCWKLTWVVEATKWFIAVYNTLSVPVSALWGATRQIKGCYYKCYLHRTGLHQIWWIFSFCFCDIKPFRDFCEYFLFVTLDYIWIHPEYPDFILLLYCPPFDNIKIPGEQLCNTFLLTSINTEKKCINNLSHPCCFERLQRLWGEWQLIVIALWNCRIKNQRKYAADTKLLLSQFWNDPETFPIDHLPLCLKNK